MAKKKIPLPVPICSSNRTHQIRSILFKSIRTCIRHRKIYEGEFMSGDFETLEINQPKIKYLNLEDNTEWLDKLINNIEDMKNKISKDS